MLDRDFYWRNRELREHVAIIDNKLQPTIVLKNGTYLNVFTKQWIQANVWVYKDRIVYVGDRLPESLDSIEVVDCEGKYIVPGYIEPHAHPFQLYNPEELANHATKYGTTTLINDNLIWYFLFRDKKKAFTLIEKMNQLSTSMYWWSRFDSQTALQDEESYFNTENVLDWSSHHSVVQGGELTAWPRLLAEDDRLLYWIQQTKRLGKPIEGHLPGASEATLTKMKLLGVSADHESMTGADVKKRLELGYQVALRHSSIRPDLPTLISEILDEDIQTFDQLTMTTDGSTPAFYNNGLMNICIDIAIQKGVPIVEAYRMATYNVAKHFHLDEEIGSIAPGKIAHINILNEKENPHPESVLAKGNWVVRDGEEKSNPNLIDWEKYSVHSLVLDWDLQESDLQFSIPVGVKMVNDVILKPAIVEIDITVDQLREDKDDAFLLLLDRNGEWRVNTIIQGFTNHLGALVSSYSITGDIICIGKNKYDMLLAWKRMKELGGGIVLVHDGKVIFELPLKLNGLMFNGPMTELIEKEKTLTKLLKDFGYSFHDPIYSIFFLSSTHLPFIRVTQQGILDVKGRNVLFPAIMR